MWRIILMLVFLAVGGSTVAAQTTDATSPPEQASSTVETRDKPSDAVLIEAVKNGEIARVVWFLQNGISPDATDEKGQHALHWAAKENRLKVAEILLVHGAKIDPEYDGDTPLAVGAGFGHEDMVKLLISHGADINHKDDGGHTPLMLAAFGANYKNIPAEIARIMFDEETAIKLTSMGNKHMAIVKLLLTRGADANAQATDCGVTPLIIAAMGGNTELGRMLLASGARVDAAAGDELTPLKLAQMDEMETIEGLESTIDDEPDEQRKRALVNWLQSTRAARREFGELLKKAGAQN